MIGTVVSREDYLVPKAGGVFNAEEYDAHPERYRSTFAEKVFITDVDLDFTTLNFLRYIYSEIIVIFMSYDWYIKAKTRLF